MQAPDVTVTSEGGSFAPPPSQLLSAVRRRLRPMLLSFVLIFGAALLAALLWPPTYRSTATILIEQQEVPTDFVRSAVTSYADERVQVISKRVMTSANLIGIIDKYKLYPGDRDRATREALVDRMHNDIKLDMISADVVDPRQGRATKATIAFSVSYYSRSPVMAAQVANELTTLYLSENIESRKQLAADTASFLKDESNRLGQRVAELESKIATFKSANGADLPENAQLNMQALERSHEELRTIETRMQTLDQQLIYLDAQLAQLSPSMVVYTENGKRVLAPVDRLKALQGELASAQARFTPAHPDVMHLKGEIAELQAELTAARGLGKQPDSNADNPAYIQVRTQRAVAQNERAALMAQIPLVRARIADLARHNTLAPDVEKNYRALLRDLAGEQARYNEVRQKQLEAQLAQNLETQRKGERFTLIEPPLQPQVPVRPQRAVIVLLGWVVATACALGLMFLLESLDTRIRDRTHLLALLGVPPLAVIPLQELDEERVARIRKRRILLAGGAAAVAAGLLAVHVFLRPLDLVWFSLLQRLGV
jgi:succinoglycan biosynthesis transport protein ExoP